MAAMPLRYPRDGPGSDVDGSGAENHRVAQPRTEPEASPPKVQAGVEDDGARAREAIAFVARHVVFADLVGRRVARDGAQGDLDDLAPSESTVGLQVAGFDPLFENA